MRPSPRRSLTIKVTAPRRTSIARARSAREIGWRARTRFKTMLRLISREVARVATVNREGLTRRICISKRLNTHYLGPNQLANRNNSSKMGPNQGGVWALEEREARLILRLDKICLPAGAVN